MRVLVTGGLGFVGNAVTYALVDAGHEPVVLTSRQDTPPHPLSVEVLHADIRDHKALTAAIAKAEPEGVCHFAALTRVRDSFAAPLTYFDVNTGGTANLLHALAPRDPVPVVFASTGAVYGPCEGQITEDQPTLPTNPYGASKLAAEDLLRYHARTAAIGATVLRCFNIAGAVGGVGDSDTTRIIPAALEVAAGRREHLGINGDGTAIREFTHVADVATATVTALEAAQPGAHHTYNVGSGPEATMLDIVKTAEQVTGRTIPVIHHPPKPEPAKLVANCTSIRQDLGWRAQYLNLSTIIRDAWSTLEQRTRDSGRQVPIRRR